KKADRQIDLNCILGGVIMEEKLRQYVEKLFAEAPKTAKLRELREEILMNLKEKYNDLRETGVSEEEAYEIVKGSIGDVEELISSAQEADVPQEAERKHQKPHNDTKHKAFKEYMGAMWLIITALYFLISFATRAWHITWVIFIIGVAVEQCIRAIFCAEDEQGGTNGEKRKKIYTSVFWMFIVIIYFVLSFATHAWYLTWIIFLIGAAINSIIRINVK
ncbi:MAG: permease prefix domain 1-containing protein, partial [Christensenella sp.]